MMFKNCLNKVSMSLFTRSSINILLLLLELCQFHWASGVNTTNYVKCTFASVESTMIQCGNNRRIHVWSTIVARLEDRLYPRMCTEDMVLPLLRYNVTDSCKFHDPLSFRSCHGRPSCSLPENVEQRFFSKDICHGPSYTTNILHINYSCVKGKNRFVEVLPMQNQISRTTLQIYSPYYPCFLPDDQFTLHCQLKIERNHTRVNITIRSLEFGSHTDHCAESISITKKDSGSNTNLPFFHFCTDAPLAQHQTVDSLNGHWNLTYTKSSLHPGERFWMIIEVMEDMTGLILRCDDNHLFPLLSLTVPGSDLPTLNDTCAFSQRPPIYNHTLNGNESDFDFGDEDDDDNDDENYAVVFGVAGSLMALLIILGVIMLVILRRTRKKKKSGKDEHGFVPKGSLPNSYCNTETKTTISAVNTGFTETEVLGKEQMYAVVNKHKTEHVKSTNQDDIVMYENEDLYEASVDEGRDNQFSKTQNTTNSGVDEETFMYENDDIYSS